MSDDLGDRDVDAPDEAAHRAHIGPTIPWYESEAAQQAATDPAAASTEDDVELAAVDGADAPGVSLLKPPAGEDSDPAAANSTDPDADVVPTPKGRGRRRYEGRRRLETTKAKKKHSAPWWELPALVVLAIAIAIIVKSFVVQPFYIPSESMEKTLHGCTGCSGDRILVNKVIFDLRDPHPGDIIVFNAPPGWNEIHTTPPSNPIVRTVRGFGQLIGFVPPDSEVLVKRVIAIGGETVQGFDVNGRSVVHVTDAKGKEHVLNEPFVFNDGADSHAAFGPVKIPKGRLWVMGDHRNNSQDSRYHCGPGASDGNFDSSCDPKSSTVPVSDVIGKAFVIAWPPSRWRTLGTPSTFDQLALSLNETVPSGSGVLLVTPLYVWRVRRRRKRRRSMAHVRA